jgi:peptide/nickel transport system substrate-binding protein
MSRPLLWLLLLLFAAVSVTMSGCHGAPPDPHTVTMLIESSPTNLDLRIGTDGQSEHIGSLIFDALVRKDEHYNVQPWLATSWDHPDPLTWIFHIRQQVHFHDGRMLTAGDVKWTLDSMHNGAIITAKSGAFTKIDHVAAPNPATCIVYMKKPDPFLLWNLSDGAIGIVPSGSGKDFWKHPIGTGPFRFVSAQQDRDVVLERSPDSWQPLPPIERIRFAVVPDAITRALELQKGSADVAINALSPDMVVALRQNSHLVIDTSPGTIVNYLAFNLRDPFLKDMRVRQAIAYAIDRQLIIHTLWRDQARLADSLLPPGHWARTDNIERYNYDPATANRILDEAGYGRGPGGTRFHLQMKISTDETTRLMALVLQQHLREIGIALDVRSYEFATFYSDITKGAFSLYALRWIGGNESPDIFRYAYTTEALPPHGANRGHYFNAAVDATIADASLASDNAEQRADYRKVQQILAREVPSINLWYLDNVLVHTPRLHNTHVSPSGDYDFLRQTTVTP